MNGLRACIFWFRRDLGKGFSVRIALMRNIAASKTKRLTHMLIEIEVWEIEVREIEGRASETLASGKKTAKLWNITSS
jgi:hypothetical protein